MATEQHTTNSLNSSFAQEAKQREDLKVITTDPSPGPNQGKRPPVISFEGCAWYHSPVKTGRIESEGSEVTESEETEGEDCHEEEQQPAVQQYQKALTIAETIHQQKKLKAMSESANPTSTNQNSVLVKQTMSTKKTATRLDDIEGMLLQKFNFPHNRVFAVDKRPYEEKVIPIMNTSPFLNPQLLIANRRKRRTRQNLTQQYEAKKSRLNRQDSNDSNDFAVSTRLYPRQDVDDADETEDEDVNIPQIEKLKSFVFDERSMDRNSCNKLNKDRRRYIQIHRKFYVLKQARQRMDAQIRTIMDRQSPREGEDDESPKFNKQRSISNRKLLSAKQMQLINRDVDKEQTIDHKSNTIINFNALQLNVEERRGTDRSSTSVRFHMETLPSPNRSQDAQKMLQVDENEVHDLQLQKLQSSGKKSPERPVNKSPPTISTTLSPLTVKNKFDRMRMIGQKGSSCLVETRMDMLMETALAFSTFFKTIYEQAQKQQVLPLAEIATQLKVAVDQDSFEKCRQKIISNLKFLMSYRLSMVVKGVKKKLPRWNEIIQDLKMLQDLGILLAKKTSGDQSLHGSYPICDNLRNLSNTTSGAGSFPALIAAKGQSISKKYLAVIERLQIYDAKLEIEWCDLASTVGSYTRGSDMDIDEQRQIATKSVNSRYRTMKTTGAEVYLQPATQHVDIEILQQPTRNRVSTSTTQRRQMLHEGILRCSEGQLLNKNSMNIVEKRKASQFDALKLQQSASDFVQPKLTKNQTVDVTPQRMAETIVVSGQEARQVTLKPSIKHLNNQMHTPQFSIDTKLNPGLSLKQKSPKQRRAQASTKSGTTQTSQEQPIQQNYMRLAQRTRGHRNVSLRNSLKTCANTINSVSSQKQNGKSINDAKVAKIRNRITTTDIYLSKPSKIV